MGSAPPVILSGVPGTGLVGLYGRPYVRLDRYLELGALPAIHEEVCLALASLPVEYTGGSHRSMGIMPPGLEAEAIVDYGEVIRGLDDAGFETFRSLADDPGAIDPAARRDAVGRSPDSGFGEERAHPLSRRQMLWLKYRHGVYFPWKVYVELIPNRWWSEKHAAEGKSFTRLAQALFPKTIAFVRALPFASIGRCNLMGLEANDHGTVHRDGEPAEQQAPDHFITFCPAPGKRTYLWDPEARARVFLDGRAYWFNDHDYHGVAADPVFRYSIRVDGVFEQGFLERVARDLREETT